MTLPLQGQTVLVTRAQDQQGEGRQRLQALGATVIDLPALVIGPPDEWGPLDDALEELEEFHWLPRTCTYRLIHEGKDIPDWHPLITGRRESVKQAGASVVSWFEVTDDQLAEEDYIDYVIESGGPA